MMYKFTLPFPPSNNTYYRHVDSKVLLSDKGRKYKKLVSDELNKLGLTGLLLEDPLIVRLELFRPDKRKYDVDNFFKCVFDSLTNAKLWTDDEIVVECQARKMPIDGIGRVEVIVDHDVVEGFF